MENNCLQCSELVRPRQEGLQCDGCQRWCHRTCGTGITRPEYRAACRTGYIEWECQPCIAASHANLPDDVPDDTATDPVEMPETTSSSSLDQTTDDPNASDLGSFVEPSLHNESEMHEPPAAPAPVIIPSQMPGPITYTIVESASSHGKDVLVDSLGYQYTLKVDKRRTAITWRCYLRSKNVTCKATVLQRDGGFVRGSQHHVCNAEPGRVKVLEVRKEVKVRASKRMFDSAAEIVEEVLLEELPPGQMLLHPTLPKPVNIARQGNVKRRKTRPQDPQDLDFVISSEHLPDDFLQKDIRVGTSRHVVLASPVMLDLLSKAHTWYLDGTFKVVRQPFYQLFSVHAFIKSGMSIKQVPLAFIMMSSRRAEDYKEVLLGVASLLPRPAALQKVVLDFEAAAWQAVRSVFPNVEVRGCLFHFTQSVYRKIQELGLQAAYNGGDPGTHDLCRGLMSLPLLPAEHIAPMFAKLRRDVPADNAQLLDLIIYVQDTWVEGRVFTPRDWTVYRQEVRTNNDVEGWHYRLNHRGKKAKLPFYLLCSLLQKEARLVTMTAELVYREEITRRQKHGSKTVTAKLNALWSQYASKERSARSLLSAGSKLICPSQNPIEEVE